MLTAKGRIEGYNKGPDLIKGLLSDLIRCGEIYKIYLDMITFDYDFIVIVR